MFRGTKWLLVQHGDVKLRCCSISDNTAVLLGSYFNSFSIPLGSYGYKGKSSVKPLNMPA